MRLLVRHARLMWAAAQVIREQRQLIDRLEQEKDATELAYMRISKDLIEQFIITLDMPENQDEIRDRLFTALGFYRDEIATREEHV